MNVDQGGGGGGGSLSMYGLAVMQRSRESSPTISINSCPFPAKMNFEGSTSCPLTIN